MEEVRAAPEGVAVPEKSETKKRRKRRRKTREPSAMADVSVTDSCGAEITGPADADAFAICGATTELPVEQKRSTKSRRSRRRKILEASTIADVSVTDSCGADVTGPADADASAICGATTELPAERVDADAVAIYGATTELLVEQKRGTSRRSRRRKMLEARAAGEVGSASDSPVVDGCGERGGGHPPVVVGYSERGGGHPLLVAGRGGGGLPTACVGSDGAVTFTIAPQHADSSPAYRDFLHWLDEARASADVPPTVDDMYMTFTIRVSPHCGAQSGTRTMAAGADGVPTATDADVAAAAGATAAGAGATADEVARLTPSARKRRNRRRRQLAEKLAAGEEAAGEAGAGHTGDVTETSSGGGAASPARPCCGCGCFSWLFPGLARLFS